MVIVFLDHMNYVRISMIIAFIESLILLKSLNFPLKCKLITDHLYIFRSGCWHINVMDFVMQVKGY